MGFAEDFLNTPQRPIGPVQAKAKQTPHSRLRKQCRDALAKATGAAGVVIPIQNVKVTIGGKTFVTGRTGAGDDFYLLRGRAFSIEYKAGRDVQRDSQAVFQKRWEAAGGVYIIARDPVELVHAVQAALR